MKCAAHADGALRDRLSASYFSTEEEHVRERLSMSGIVLVAGLVSVLSFPAPGANQVLDLTQRYQVISRKDVSKLQRDLNKAGLNGIRVVMGSDTGGGEVALLLEKSKEQGARFEYIIISESDAGNLEKRIGLAASQGFRLMPQTVTAKGKTFGGSNVVLLMEKTPPQNTRYEYLLLDTSLPATLQVTLASAIDKGYRVIGMVKRKNAYLLILEKKA